MHLAISFCFFSSSSTADPRALLLAIRKSVKKGIGLEIQLYHYAKYFFYSKPSKPETSKFFIYMLHAGEIYILTRDAIKNEKKEQERNELS